MTPSHVGGNPRWGHTEGCRAWCRRVHSCLWDATIQCPSSALSTAPSATTPPRTSQLIPSPHHQPTTRKSLIIHPGKRVTSPACTQSTNHADNPPTPGAGDRDVPKHSVHLHQSAGSGPWLTMVLILQAVGSTAWGLWGRQLGDRPVEGSEVGVAAHTSLTTGRAWHSTERGIQMMIMTRGGTEVRCPCATIHGDNPSPNPSRYEVAFFQPRSITYGWLKALTLPSAELVAMQDQTQDGGMSHSTAGHIPTITAPTAWPGPPHPTKMLQWVLTFKCSSQCVPRGWQQLAAGAEVPRGPASTESQLAGARRGLHKRGGVGTRGGSAHGSSSRTLQDMGAVPISRTCEGLCPPTPISQIGPV